MKTSPQSALWRNEHGSSFLEIALTIPFFLLLLIIAIDLGRAYFVAIETQSAAQAAALYATQNKTDTAGMIAAAKLDAANITTLTVTATYGCQCSDGTLQVALCSTAPTCVSNVVNYAQVNTTAVYVPMLPYPGVPPSITFKGKAMVRSSHD